MFCVLFPLPQHRQSEGVITLQSTARASCALQVLAQLHGVTSDGDVEDEQQEDALPSNQGKEHRRPHSAGNLVEQATTSNSHSSSSSHRAGRPPLAETTANNKLGLKVCLYSLTPHSLTHSFTCPYIFASQVSSQVCGHLPLHLPHSMATTLVQAVACRFTCATGLLPAASACVATTPSPLCPVLVLHVDQQDSLAGLRSQITCCIICLKTDCYCFRRNRLALHACRPHPCCWSSFCTACAPYHALPVF